MKTKAVYVVVSGDNDIYFEQAWVSAWSLKHYNPEMRVECVVDQDTYENIVGGYRKKALEVIDELVKIDVPTELTKKEQSRWLKTNLRNLVQGDYLFIDTDTVICDKLDEVDDFEHDVMMAQEGDCPVSAITSYKIIQEQVRTICGKELETERYFNSGVIYCKDTLHAHTLYDKWYNLWKESCKRDVPFDQKALAIVIEGTDDVKEMSGIYNCQIRFSIKYLADAKILHFYSARSYYPDYTHPFFGESVYLQVKEQGEISRSLANDILNCKTLFISPILLIAKEELSVRNSRAFSFLVRIQKQYPYYYRFIQSTAVFQNKILSGIQKFQKYLHSC